jgi:acyl-CoA synthetase (AMP-forming)/AMP-acid ligase II
MGPTSDKLLTDQLRLMADHFPDECAYGDVDTGRQMTFKEWDRDSDRVAGALGAAGVVKGDRVAIYLPPEEALAWLVAYAATHKAGAVAVPTNTRLARRELEFVLRHSGAVAAFAGSATTATLEAAQEATPTLRWAATTAAAPPPGWAAWDALQPAPPAPLAAPAPPPVDVTGGDIADIMYTSGTTGRPKGVVVRHRDAATVPYGLPRWSGDGWLHCSPFFTFAGIASVYNPMKLGMTGLYLARFDAGAWLEAVQRLRPAAVFLVPAMVKLLLAHPRFGDADLSSVHMASVGSAPLAPETFRRLRERLPQAWVSNNWGMTEAGPAFCVLPPDEAARRVGSVGKPVPPVVLRIISEDGQELPPGEVGELLVSNPGREREYFNDPEATARTWRDGWLHTGDLAYLDADGFLYIAGRKKDVIIRGGHNVHAADVESALLEHPAVLDAAVAGIPHPVLGEDVAAWVVLRPGQVADSDVFRDFLADRLSDYKRPRQIVFVTELPRNATGKVLKHRLTREADSGADSRR